jgi:hypothetical protein
VVAAVAFVALAAAAVGSAANPLTALIPAAGTTPTAGTGFTYTHTVAGVYVFTYSTSFASAPVVLVTEQSDGGIVGAATSSTVSGVTVTLRDTGTYAHVNAPFSLLVVPMGYAPSSGGAIAESDVTGLVADLAGKASSTDARFPTTDEKAALAGTSGAPSAANRYRTEADSSGAASSTFSAEDSGRLNIIGWGVWFLVGLTFCVMVSALWQRSFRLWS